MENVVVNSRIMQRYPELCEDDVLEAWKSTIAAIPRVGGEREKYVAVGVDCHGRLVEMVAARMADGRWAIYYAMTPPSRKTLVELKISRR